MTKITNLILTALLLAPLAALYAADHKPFRPPAEYWNAGVLLQRFFGGRVTSIPRMRTSRSRYCRCR